MIITHKEFGTYEIVDILQKHLEAYITEITEKNMKELPGAVYARMSIELAIKTGIISIPESEVDITLWKPSKVMWVSAQISKAIASCLEVPTP